MCPYIQLTTIAVPLSKARVMRNIHLVTVLHIFISGYAQESLTKVGAFKIFCSKIIIHLHLFLIYFRTLKVISYLTLYMHSYHYQQYCNFSIVHNI